MLKKEFDEHRNNGTAHHLITEAGIDAIPFMHETLINGAVTLPGFNFFIRKQTA